ncbi:hypothetical protein COHA_005220 [Chlorella ohadii]|uniref:Uncharacterized protein n=1 Tax=Chlorella ohadii TaxID=2649997 RepID=A0AAD5DRK0_9CHLO|nr:hypothetical protein COHA_005220 [Chlorella ohadii]
MRRRTPAEMAAAFTNRRLVFLGDSHVLYMHNWLAIALGGRPHNASAETPALSQKVAGGHIQMEMYRRQTASDVSALLHSWNKQQWPDVLVVGALEWPVMLTRNITRHLSEMRTLLTTLREQVRRDACLDMQLLH